MKKIIVVLLTVLLIGCNLSNTPSERVEEYFSKYNSLDEKVVLDLDVKIAGEDLSDENKETYKKVLLNQFENLKYEIKDESINGDKAEVLAKITVIDLFKVENESLNYMNENNSEFYDTNNMFDKEAFNTYRLGKMMDAKDTVSYDIRFYLNKVNDEWIIKELNRDDLEKIHGLYDYKNE